jgi:hypothetical protein
MPLVRFVLVIALLAPAMTGTALAADTIAVQATSGSTPESCAEKDNVAINFSSPLISSFRLEAVHPAYIGMIAHDRYLPDYTSCDMTPGVEFAAGSERVTFWETPRYWITGYRLKEFWRPADVPVRVGDRVEKGFHFIQFWMRYRERAEEVLVLYPPDGYWRIRPLPPGEMRWTAYGSSFLLGPVEVQERPIVAIRDIAFDPESRTFTLNFKRGGSAKIILSAIDEDRLALDVRFDGPLPRDLPFASLRSMYMTQQNADAAQVAWRAPGTDGWSETPVLQFRGASVSDFWLGRHGPSRHNLSAPDFVVDRFTGSAAK